MKSELSIAQQMLSLVFEGYNIRTVIVDGTPRFFRNDVAAACGITNIQKSILRHVDPDELGCIKVQVRSTKSPELGATKVAPRSANGTTQIREFATLTESGVLALVFASRKPAARRFRRWVTEVVMPDIIRYGTFLGEATKGERVNALYGRYKQSRTSFISEDAQAYEASGLLTISAFRKMEPCPGEDVFLLSRELRAIAREKGFEPERYFTGKRTHTPAWPREMLAAARRRANGPAHFIRFSLAPDQ